MKNWMKAHKGLTVALCVMLFLSTAVVIDAARFDREYFNELCRGYIYLTQNAEIRGTANNYGQIGNSSSQVRGVYSRKVDADSVITTYTQSDTVSLGTTVGGPNGSILMTVRNVTGLGVGKGRAMKWAPVVEVVALLPKNTANRAISDSLKTTGAKYTLACVVAGTAGATDTLYVKGKDASGVTQTASMKLTAGATTTTMVSTGIVGKTATKLYWSKIDSVSYLSIDGADSAQVIAYPYGSVSVCGASSAGLFAGVTVDTLTLGGTGRICISGTCLLRVNSYTTALIPGGMLETAAWGVGLVDASATVATNIGVGLEYAKMDSLLTQVFIGRY